MLYFEGDPSSIIDINKWFTLLSYTVIKYSPMWFTEALQWRAICFDTYALCSVWQVAPIRIPTVPIYHRHMAIFWCLSLVRQYRHLFLPSFVKIVRLELQFSRRSLFLQCQVSKWEYMLSLENIHVNPSSWMPKLHCAVLRMPHRALQQLSYVTDCHYCRMTMFQTKEHM